MPVVDPCKECGNSKWTCGCSRKMISHIVRCPACKVTLNLTNRGYKVNQEEEEEFEQPTLHRSRAAVTKTLKSAELWDAPPGPPLKFSYVAEPPGLGISTYWRLPDTHEFYIPSIKHDCRYSLRRCGYLNGALFETSEHSDEKFKKDCDKVLLTIYDTFGPDRHDWLEGEAVIFYGIVRAVGSKRWPTPSTDLEVIKAEMGNVFKCLDILKAAGETNVCLTMFSNVESI